RGVRVGERGLIGGDAGQRQACRSGSQRDRRTRGVAEHERWFGPGRGGDRGEVVVLALRRERGGVAAVTSPAAVVGDDGEAPPEFLWCDEGMARAERSYADYQHRAVAGRVICDLGAIGLPGGFFGVSFPLLDSFRLCSLPCA